MKELKQKINEKHKGISGNNLELYSSVDYTACPRKVYYRNKSLNLDNSVRMHISMDDRINSCEFNEISKIWFEIFQGLDGVQVSKKDLSFSDVNHNLHGRLNLVIKFDNIIYGVNIYKLTCDEFELSEKKDKAYRRHVVDNMMNLWMSEIKNGIIIYFCENNFNLFKVRPENYIIKSVIRGIDKVNNSIDIPERPYKTSDVRECRGCYFKNKCWR